MIQLTLAMMIHKYQPTVARQVRKNTIKSINHRAPSPVLPSINNSIARLLRLLIDHHHIQALLPKHLAQLVVLHHPVSHRVRLLSHQAPATRRLNQVLQVALCLQVVVPLRQVTLPPHRVSNPKIINKNAQCNWSQDDDQYIALLNYISESQGASFSG